MALAEQTEFAFMKAAKGTDVPKPEVIELDEHIDAYKKKYGLTDEEVIEILRSLLHRLKLNKTMKVDCKSKVVQKTQYQVMMFLLVH